MIKIKNILLPGNFILLIGLLINSCTEHKNHLNENTQTASFVAGGIAGNEDTEGDSMVLIEGGKLNTSDYETGENKLFELRSFYLDKNLVTVAQFSEFVNKTGYKTEAERFGNSAIFDFNTGEWRIEEGAYYLYPFGKNGQKAELNHPVTQVSWNDAFAYAKWKGKRLPTAAEWEWAARSAGKSDYIYAWGDEMKEGKVFKANFWQGEFPYKNTDEDGFHTTSPVGYFGSNNIGLNDMGGNVWQWTSDKVRPTPEESLTDTTIRIVTKGGSFLCDPEVCHGFKVNGKSSSTSETGMVHTGFRCAR
jgi:formylglycine-generating enzyme